MNVFYALAFHKVGSNALFDHESAQKVCVLLFIIQCDYFCTKILKYSCIVASFSCMVGGESPATRSLNGNYQSLPASICLRTT